MNIRQQTGAWLNAVPEPHAARWLYLDGTRNSRDLGGLATQDGRTVRSGQCFRSDVLNDLSEADHAVLGARGVRTIIDLRGPQERQRMPNRLPSLAAPTQLLHGFVPTGTDEMLGGVRSGQLDSVAARAAMVRQYQRLALEDTRPYREVLRQLGEVALPCIIHCTSGKDRTGLMSAFLLTVLGVDWDDVMEDYLLTNCFERDVGIFAPESDPQAVFAVMSAQPEYLESALHAITSRHGSLAAFIAGELGVDAELRERLKARFVA